MTRTPAEGTDRPALATAGDGISPDGSPSRRQRSRRLLRYSFAAGVLVSVCSAVVFYLLLKTLHNPLIFTEYWKNISDQQWVSAYAAWQNIRFDYTMGYGISVLAALVSAGGFAISFFPRGALVTSFAFLNVLYAWTAHVFLTISNAFGQTVIKAISAEDMFFWNFVDLRYGYSTLIVADIESPYHAGYGGDSDLPPGHPRRGEEGAPACIPDPGCLLHDPRVGDLSLRWKRVQPARHSGAGVVPPSCLVQQRRPPLHRLGALRGEHLLAILPPTFRLEANPDPDALKRHQ